MKRLIVLLSLVASLNTQASIGTPEQSITIQDIGTGISVASITSSGSELLNTTADSDIFTLNLTNTSNNQNYSINSRTGWSSVGITETAQQYSILLSSPAPADLPPTLQVEITINANNGKSDWDIAVTGLANFTLVSAKAPQLNFKAAGNDTVFVPRFSGKLHKNPVANNLDWNRKYPAGWHATMQYLAYYNSQYGLYLGFHDPKANDKFFHARAQNGGLLIEADYPAPDATIAGNSWQMPGVFELDMFQGDWYDAAKIYQSWVSAQAEYYPQDSPERDARLREIGNISVWATFSEAPALVHLAEPLTIAFADYMGVPTGLTWYRWNGLQQDEKYPAYFPPTANMDVQVGNMQNHTPKIRVVPYINGRLFDVDLDGSVGDNQYIYALDGEPYAVKDALGTIPTTVYNGFTFATMCPSQPYWQQIIKNAVTRITETIGSAGMYIDQVGAARSYPCMDPTHGHTLNGGHYWRDGYQSMLSSAYTGISSGKFLTTESGTDYILDVMDGFMVQGWQANDQVPAFHVIYSGKVMFYGMKTGVSQYQDSLPEFYMKLAQAYAYGVQLGRFFTSIVNETGTVEKAPIYIKKLATMHHKLLDFFSFGKMQRPLNISGLPTITAIWQHTFDGSIQVTIDAIQTSTWLSEKFGIKRLMFTFTNAHVLDADSVSFNFDFNAADYGLSGPLHIQTITQDSNGPVEITADTFSKPVTLLPRDTVSYIISPSPVGLDEFNNTLFMDSFE
jgi:hypothetical protein